MGWWESYEDHERRRYRTETSRYRRAWNLAIWSIPIILAALLVFLLRIYR